jgi:hypothetical protein
MDKGSFFSCEKSFVSLVFFVVMSTRDYSDVCIPI